MPVFDRLLCYIEIKTSYNKTATVEAKNFDFHLLNALEIKG